MRGLAAARVARRRRAWLRGHRVTGSWAQPQPAHVSAGTWRPKARHSPAEHDTGRGSCGPYRPGFKAGITGPRSRPVRPDYSLTMAGAMPPWAGPHVRLVLGVASRHSCAGGTAGYSDAVGSILYCDAALADGRSARLRVGVSLLAEHGRVRWIRPAGEERKRPPGCEVIDAGGTTIIPGLVDGHSHLTLPGGSHWIDGGADPTETLVDVAESNGELQHRPGVGWARDVGSPHRVHNGISARSACWSGTGGAGAVTGRMCVRRAPGSRWPECCRPGCRWRPATGMSWWPRRSASWTTARISSSCTWTGPTKDTAPWTAAEVGRVVGAVHARGATVTAHATSLPGARVCAEAGVDSIEHGFELDADVTRLMADRGVALVTTMTVLKSWLTFQHDHGDP